MDSELSRATPAVQPVVDRAGLAEIIAAAAVAAWVEADDDPLVLVTQRHPETHLGGLWELSGARSTLESPRRGSTARTG